MHRVNGRTGKIRWSFISNNCKKLEEPWKWETALKR